MYSPHIVDEKLTTAAKLIREARHKKKCIEKTIITIQSYIYEKYKKITENHNKIPALLLFKKNLRVIG
ncbi:MAG: hypothetical protein A3F11_01400 [Gammaproteobacteria bacterium RIFCSPHIGHO2_12_FULL_37_14]|nr:MAG: hypothetical protein A3F11_01400 [Gammaproteobacteria bacterium RIFCSPHIGHO2_12_FULL_37_14]